MMWTVDQGGSDMKGMCWIEDASRLEVIERQSPMPTVRVHEAR